MYSFSFTVITLDDSQIWIELSRSDSSQKKFPLTLMEHWRFSHPMPHVNGPIDRPKGAYGTVCLQFTYMPPTWIMTRMTSQFHMLFQK